jgi:hypothetical protein
VSSLGDGAFRAAWFVFGVFFGVWLGIYNSRDWIGGFTVHMRFKGVSGLVSGQLLKSWCRIVEKVGRVLYFLEQKIPCIIKYLQVDTRVVTARRAIMSRYNATKIFVIWRTVANEAYSVFPVALPNARAG